MYFKLSGPGIDFNSYFFSSSSSSSSSSSLFFSCLIFLSSITGFPCYRLKQNILTFDVICQQFSPSLNMKVLKVWSHVQQHQHYMGTCQTCKLPGNPRPQNNQSVLINIKVILMHTKFENLRTTALIKDKFFLILLILNIVLYFHI